MMTDRAKSNGRMRLVVSSANPEKAAEIAEILLDALGDRIELVRRPTSIPEVEEHGSTFVDNARAKAAALCAATGEAAVADDSGLEVDALGGRPGVRSARYAGEQATYAQNVTKLLQELGDVADRRARFHTIAIACFPDGEELIAEGSVEGMIAPAPRGSGGFGYDPVFVPIGGDGRSFAELSSVEKHQLSARGKAFRELAALLGARLPEVSIVERPC